MEVDSADEQEEDARSQGGQAHSQVSRSNSTGATFNTLSSLGSLRPGRRCTLPLKYLSDVIGDISIAFPVYYVTRNISEFE